MQRQVYTRALLYFVSYPLYSFFDNSIIKVTHLTHHIHTSHSSPAIQQHMFTHGLLHFPTCRSTSNVFDTADKENNLNATPR